MTAQIREPAACVAVRARWMLWAMACGWMVARMGRGISVLQNGLAIV